MRKQWHLVAALCALVAVLAGTVVALAYASAESGRVRAEATIEPVGDTGPEQTALHETAAPEQSAEAPAVAIPSPTEAAPEETLPPLSSIDEDELNGPESTLAYDDSPMVALTFDDGPYRGVTDAILDVVEQYKDYGVKVTFFALGLQIKQYPELVKRAYELGCEIGNHTYDHKRLTKLSESRAKAEVEDVNDMLREITGESAALVRPPYGSRNDKLAELLSYPFILWDVDTRDWATRNADSTLSAALECVDGDIVLMHDVHSDTAEAVARIIPELIARGYKLVTVSELFEAKGIQLEPGVAYRHAR